MAKINVVRVILGGLLAGVVINVIEGVVSGMILADQFESQLGKELPSWAIPAFIVWGFLVGIMAVWIYASIRAQYGPGPRTAVMAGVMTWILGYALPNYSFWAVGIFSGSLMAIASAIGLAELILATLAGAWVYKPAEEIVAIEPGVSA